MKLELDKNIEEIFERFESFNYEAYLVGGCLRDILMNNKPHDFDITTSAKPNEVHEIFKDRKIIDTGLKHGTVTLMYNHIPYEITTYRSESTYSDHRHPDEVKFSTNLSDDLKRRDFTINAMAYNHKNGLIDLYGGINDINNKIIRTVGNPEERFNEDALRILRAIRFSSRYDFEIEKETKDAIFKYKDLLKEISYERIEYEFRQILQSNNIKYYLEEYKEIFEIFIPEIKLLYDHPQNNKYHSYDLWNHTLLVTANTPNDYILRYAGLFHDIGKPESKTIGDDNYNHYYGHELISVRITNKILRRLKMANDDIKEIIDLIKWHDYYLDTPKAIKKCLGALGFNQMEKLLKLKYADELGKNTIYSRNKEYFDNIYNQMLEYENEALNIKDLDINGDDLIKLGFKGKEIGDALKILLEKVLDDDIKNDKKELIDYLKNLK